MKERPILFNTDMVKAILDGRKTQTRRPVKNQPKDGWEFEDAQSGGAFGRITSSHPKKGKFGAFIRRGVGTDFPEIDIEVCPFGMRGDRLWVRETFQGPIFDSGLVEDYQENPDNYKNPEFCYYKASDSCQEFYTLDDELVSRWTPSIHMPRWACRLVLEITDVRLDRVQDITEKDAWAEGCERHHDDVIRGRTNSGEFMDLWDSVYGKDDALNVNANPWVWVIDFKIIEPNCKTQEQSA